MILRSRSIDHPDRGARAYHCAPCQVGWRSTSPECWSCGAAGTVGVIGITTAVGALARMGGTSG